VSIVLQSTDQDLSKSSLSIKPVHPLKNLKKKKKRITLKKYKTGRWDEKEHTLFINAFMKHGNDWKSVESIMRRRSAEQIRSHSQKYFIKVQKKYSVYKKGGVEVKYESEFDRKFLDIFRRDKKKIFFVRKVHKDHDKNQCWKKKKSAFLKVFSIEKELKETRNGTHHSNSNIEVVEEKDFVVKHQRITESAVQERVLEPAEHTSNKYENEHLLIDTIRNLLSSNQVIMNHLWDGKVKEFNNLYFNLLTFMRGNSLEKLNFMDEAYPNNYELLQFLKNINNLESDCNMNLTLRNLTEVTNKSFMKYRNKCNII